MRLSRKLILEKTKEWGKKILQLIFNPRLLLCLFIGWMITNGWSYVLLGFGLVFKITWMQAVAGTYLGLLWIPFTPEKILTVAIALFLMRLLFPKDEKTLGVLRDLLRRERERHRAAKERRRMRRQERRARKAPGSTNAES